MIVQDTALFYSSRLNLSTKKAWYLVENIVDRLRQYGGCLTLNWHYRSLAPERLWRDFYTKMLELLDRNLGSFRSASEIVEWFDTRRRAEFKKVEFDSDNLLIKIMIHGDTETELCLRIYHPLWGSSAKQTEPFREISFIGSLHNNIRVSDLKEDYAVAQ